MTHPTINCERFNEQLADFLERSVSEPTRAAMETHALSCDDCGPLLADLRRLRIDAANLPELTPSRDLWSGVASRIEAPVLSLPGARSARRRIWSNPVFVSLAAAGLVAITATITHKMDGGRSLGGATAAGPVDRSAGGPQTNGATGATVTTSQAPDVTAQNPLPPVAVVQVDSGPRVQRSTGLPTPSARLASNTRPSAQQTYDREIARLLVVYNQRRPALDSTTIAVVKKNLKIIDDAITQTKVALRRDPASQFLMESLNDEFDTKVQLLRKVAMLPSGT